MRKYRFLVVDEDPNIISTVQSSLGSFQGEILAARSWIEAMEKTETPGGIDLLFMGAQISGAKGSALLREVRSKWPLMPVIVLCRESQVELAEECMRFGARHCIFLPVNQESFKIITQKALRSGALDQCFEGMRYNLTGSFRPGEVVGNPGVLEKALEWTRSSGGRALPILLVGDSGSEKPYLAKALHYGGSRRENPFVTANLIAGSSASKSEAMSGTNSHKPGLLRSAHGGTLFLEEVADLSLETQKVLLDVITRGVIHASGQKTEVDVQVITGTGKDLVPLVRSGKFLPELHQALNSSMIRITPLCERRNEIPDLARRLILRIAEEEGLIPPRLTPEAEEYLKAYAWPGNLRELRSVIERAMLLAEESELDARHLPSEISGASGAGIRPAGEIIPFIDEERAILKHALEVTGGKIPEAAKRLAIGRATLYRKVKKYNLR